MEQMAADGVQRVVAFALAPHCSHISLGGYRKAVEEAQEKLAPKGYPPFDIPYIKCWHHNERWREMIVDLMREGLQTFPEEVRDRVTVVFSAHSLPERIRTWDDPYEGQLLESSADIARRLGLRDWRFAFQSAGSTGEPWLGPDIVPFLETLNSEGIQNVLSVPLGFVSDHLEILYDLDIEAKEKAQEMGMTYYRTAMPNARPDFIEVLASVVEENLNTPVVCSCYPEIAQSAPLTMVANK
jgi:ferrochelatase